MGDNSNNSIKSLFDVLQHLDENKLFKELNNIRIQFSKVDFLVKDLDPDNQYSKAFSEIRNHHSSAEGRSRAALLEEINNVERNLVGMNMHRLINEGLHDEFINPRGDDDESWLRRFERVN